MSESGASQVALMVKNPPANQETKEMQVLSLGSGISSGGGQGSLLHYSCLGIPWTEEPGGL